MQCFRRYEKSECQTLSLHVEKNQLFYHWSSLKKKLGELVVIEEFKNCLPDFIFKIFYQAEALANEFVLTQSFFSA